MVCQQGLKITEELVQRVEVVYVLGLFLLGKHRKKVSHSFHIVFNQNLIETFVVMLPMSAHNMFSLMVGLYLT